MITTLRTACDRAGHRALVLFAALLLAAATAEAAGNYSAPRFDVLARVAGGDLDVTESITFAFESGTFTYVFREISTSRTDGIAIVGAAMDGRPFTPGDGPGHYRITGSNRVRVEWRFDQIGPSTHRFDLHYIARGVAYRQGDADVLRWRALPAEHRYRIDASRIQFEPSDARALPPETHDVATASLHASNETVTIEATGIKANGWIVAELHYPAGRLAATQPAWRTRDQHALDMAPKWAMAGAATLIAALIVVVGLRQRYTAPAVPVNDTASTTPPQPLPAALASVLAARGRLTGYQPIGTILDLADRGALEIREVPGVLGTRAYELAQVSGSHDLEPHEIEALTIAFGGHGDEVSLARARARLGRQGRRFNTVVTADLSARGYIDDERKAARDRLTVTALVMLLGGALGCVAAAPFIPKYQGWPFLLPLGLALGGLVGVIMAASMTQLSDAGLIEAARWLGFKRHLKTLASHDAEGASAVPSRWIVYAISLGLGYYWWRHLKRHPAMAPRWFIAAGDDGGTAFAAFVGSHAASGSAGGAGGAAAGGGASGAG